MSRRAHVILLALMLAGCKPAYPRHALTLEATSLDGKPLDAAALRGKPWVIALWMPG